MVAKTTGLSFTQAAKRTAVEAAPVLSILVQTAIAQTATSTEA
jgi:hypothetical protein